MSQVSVKAALETAIDSMAGIIPAVSIVNSFTGPYASFETNEPHGLVNGVSVDVSGHTGSIPDVNGSYTVSVINDTRFGLRDSVSGDPIVLSSAGVGGTVKANLTAWYNVSFVPVNDVPYQKVDVLFARPQNPSYGVDLTREIGFMQVSLYYPKNRGDYDMGMRAEAIRKVFKRGATFVKDGIQVNISGTPEVMQGDPEDTWAVKIVRIPFWADVFE